MNRQVAEQLIGILDVGREGIAHLANCIHEGALSPEDMIILDTLTEMLPAVEEAVAGIPILNRVKDINSNLDFYMKQLQESFADGDVDGFLYNFQFHFCSMFRILELEVSMLIEQFIDKDDFPHLYPEVGEMDHSEILHKGTKARYKASVVLLAYNNLNYTRDCVESILANTHDVDYELILVDNGSTDGTKAYFESISGAKVIHLKYNLHVVKGFNMGMMAAEGQYCAVLCNDFIFTPNWLSNLMICIESDPAIGYVSPGATYISNLQMVDIPFISKEDFQERARAYNVSNPSMWEERIVLLPNVLCSPTALLDRIGYYDTRFFRGEFADDDISFKIRRAGYKLVYCADTVTHHYGSVTTVSDHMTNSMEEGRRIFLDKYGLDAWQDARISSVALNIDYQRLSGIQTVLGIDVKCGADLLHVKNKLWSEFGTKAKLSVCTTEPKYVDDLITISEDVKLFHAFTSLSEMIDEKYDLVYIEKPLDLYHDDLDDVFSGLANIVKKNGRVIFTVNNRTNVETILEMLNASYTLHHKKIYMRDLVAQQAAKWGFEPYSIVNFCSEQRSSMSENVIKALTQCIAGTDMERASQLEVMLKSQFTVFQMRYC
ncbi:glycosyltransferase family 2 protein [Paenibacillus kobensis]|uniref:glycosyltransferase family 2 protein n=1 Tax=Paenibacillus kobensis TaxID=59841 RepID=UPI000FDAE21E|nr:glycosyltransferase [Paenibacillus kobensis]